jgi:hypothetical protein
MIRFFSLRLNGYIYIFIYVREVVGGEQKGQNGVRIRSKNATEGFGSALTRLSCGAFFYINKGRRGVGEFLK